MAPRRPTRHPCRGTARQGAPAALDGDTARGDDALVIDEAPLVATPAPRSVIVLSVIVRTSPWRTRSQVLLRFAHERLDAATLRLGRFRDITRSE